MSYGRLIKQANVQQHERPIISSITVSGKDLARWLQYIEDRYDIETFWMDHCLMGGFGGAKEYAAKSMHVTIDTQDEELNHNAFIGIVPVSEEQMDKDYHYVDRYIRDTHLSIVQKALDELEEYVYNEGVSVLGLYCVTVGPSFITDEKTKFEVTIRSYQEF